MEQRVEKVQVLEEVALLRVEVQVELLDFFGDFLRGEQIGPRFEEQAGRNQKHLVADVVLDGLFDENQIFDVVVVQVPEKLLGLLDHPDLAAVLLAAFDELVSLEVVDQAVELVSLQIIEKVAFYRLHIDFNVDPLVVL